MKTSRLMAIVLALQRSGKISASGLAASLEVSVRTIYRDVDALCAAGVPIFAERGSQGGIVLDDSYRDALARFDQSELRALFISSDTPLADLGLVDGRRSALRKIASAMPKQARESIGFERSRVHVDARRWLGASSTPPAALGALQRAVWNDRSVAIAYTDRAGKVSRRTIDPLGLVSKAGIWYVVARDRDALKTFRVARIARVRALERGFDRPADFDVGEHWRTMAKFEAGDDPPFVATFRMERAALANASVYLNVESKRRVPKRAGKWYVRIAFPSIDVATFEALAWYERAVAMEPPELRARIAARARAICDTYDAMGKADA